MNKERVRELLEIYGKAWVTQDPDLIVSVFTENAIYNDPHEPENVGLKAIRQYWIDKVVEGQSEISFDLKNVWIDGETVIAEWFARFKDVKQNVFIEMEEIAILVVDGDKFSSLREYYKTKKSPL